MNTSLAHTNESPARMSVRRIVLHVIALLACCMLVFTMAMRSADAAYAAPPVTAAPGAGAGDGAGSGAGAGAGTGTGVSVSINGGSKTQASTAVQVLVLMTVLALAPSILIMMTGFTRILIVLGFIRNALGTPTMPPNQVLIGLSLFLTLFVMFPTVKAINTTAIQPYNKNEITQRQALSRAQVPLREFMFKQTNDSDLALFVKLSDMKRPETRKDIPTYVLVPAFLISELKTAFQIGFMIFIPFLIIDMVVSSTLMSMGMIMLPPVMISLPFKILLFVLVDGWHLTIESLVMGFGPR